MQKESGRRRWGHHRCPVEWWTLEISVTQMWLSHAAKPRKTDTEGRHCPESSSFQLTATGTQTRFQRVRFEEGVTGCLGRGLPKAMGAERQQPNPSDPTLSVTYSELTGQDPESSRVWLQSIQIQFSAENGNKPSKLGT